MLSYAGIRCHTGFENFQYKIPLIENIADLKAKFTELSHRCDQTKMYTEEIFQGVSQLLCRLLLIFALLYMPNA